MISGLKATLFGKFTIQQNDRDLEGIESRKVQELFGYLLLFRQHVQSREVLCDLLWGDKPSKTSKKCLRQTLWRIQSALRTSGNSKDLAFSIDNDWIQINISSNLWLDVAEFERVFQLVKGKKVQELSLRQVKLLEYATSLYGGDLLEGCYQDWCIFERERFQTMHLMLLDKLVQFCELQQNYESGLAYGLEILRLDHTYERTHRQLMRLYFLAGNRSQALHQYERCSTALREELGVEPSERTKQLYQQIRLDHFQPATLVEENTTPKTKNRTTPGLKDVLHRLQEVSDALSRLESKIQKEVVVLDDTAGL